jgi:hypothetical protein
MIRTNARQQGGAVVLTIPADVLKLKLIKAGDPLGIEVTPDGFTVRKAGLPDTHSAVPGPVVCEPLGIRFPALFRGAVTTTQEDLKAIGAADDPTLVAGDWVHYALHKDPAPLGTVTWEEVTHLLPGDQPNSVAIRYHPTIESAMGYIDATLDLGLGKPEEEANATGRMLYETESGIFTFTQVRTNPAWPGPLVIYLANVPSARWLDSEPWAHAVGPDGEVIELPEFAIPRP